MGAWLMFIPNPDKSWWQFWKPDFIQFQLPFFPLEDHEPLMVSEIPEWQEIDESRFAQVEGEHVGHICFICDMGEAHIDIYAKEAIRDFDHLIEVAVDSFRNSLQLTAKKMKEN